MNTGKTLAACFAVLFAAACAGRVGDDDEDDGDDATGLDAFQYEGFYVLDQVSLENGLAPRDDVLTRAAPRSNLRGDFEFAPITAKRARLTGRIAVLDEGAIANGSLREIDVEMLVDDGRWTVESRMGETFAVSLEGDRLSLEALPHLERKGGEEPRLNPVPIPEQETLPFRRLEATRGEPWGTEMVGRWNVVRVAFADRDIVTKECVAEGDVSSRIDATVEISPSWMYAQVVTTSHFGDTACAVPIGKETRLRVGFVEERDRNLLTWTYDPDDPAKTSVAAVFELQPDRGDTMTLSRVGCRFECPDGGPTRIELRRAQTR